MAQSMHAQKKRTSPVRAFWGAFFLLLAIAAISCILVFVLYVFKQNNLPWTLDAVLLTIIALLFLIVSILLLCLVSSVDKYDDLNHCPKCGYNLHQSI